MKQDPTRKNNSPENDPFAKFLKSRLYNRALSFLTNERVEEEKSFSYNVVDSSIKFPPFEKSRNRYLKSKIDPKIEQEIKSKILGNRDNFERFLQEIPPIKMNYRSMNKRREKMMLRIQYLIYIRYIVWKYTKEIPPERVRRILQYLPAVARAVWFGPSLTNEVYNAGLPKFHFSVDPSLPKLATIMDVARYFDVSVNRILGYCITQDNKKKTRHIFKTEEKSSPFYRHVLIPKKSGGHRLISIPSFELKKFQKKILETILEKATLHDAATGFRKQYSIKNNAEFHENQAIVINMDLHNFFPSLKFAHVYEVFRGFKYSIQVAAVLACLCTDFFNHPTRFAPQGSPPGPMIGNLYALALDHRLDALWKANGFVYSRYADDLTFSTDNPKVTLSGLIDKTYAIIRDEHLQVNTRKTRIMRRKTRQKVTGLVVNDKVGITREWIRILRAESHHYSKSGFPAGEEGDRERNRIAGKLAFLRMISSDKASKLGAKLKIH